MLAEMVASGTLSPELAIQVLVRFDKVLCCDINRFFLRRYFSVRLLGGLIIICQM
jgi:hypothetical protein